MTVRSDTPTYSIRDVAALTGLPASTLRYYESIGVPPAVDRARTSGHRRYSQGDLDLLSWLACLAATGMPISDMREYIANGRGRPSSAAEQIELLLAQDQRLAEHSAQIAVRRQYVQLKVAYWQDVQAGDTERVEDLAAQAAALADQLKKY